MNVNSYKYGFVRTTNNMAYKSSRIRGAGRRGGKVPHTVCLKGALRNNLVNEKKEDIHFKNYEKTRKLGKLGKKYEFLKSL